MQIEAPDEQNTSDESFITFVAGGHEKLVQVIAETSCFCSLHLNDDEFVVFTPVILPGNSGF